MNKSRLREKQPQWCCDSCSAAFAKCSLDCFPYVSAFLLLVAILVIICHRS